MKSENFMVRVEEIRQMPVSVKAEFITGAAGMHESLLRGWHALQFSQGLIRAGMPAAYVTDLVDYMMGWS